ncbi:WD40 repeat-like protein [Auricularia subglabra TFB-10046 SS5]|uniref:WD40 repeat-like protein n=1 Tax=Auricularia subglabra (strain TFB-10046 / SS5) TaxID=717982 RepID=J0WW79_AURST|nr:WD40 repeat-like protein [Auricularia subglabra TFB-10046 SS5]
MLMIQVFTGTPPWPHCESTVVVHKTLTSTGGYPRPGDEATALGLDDRMWDVFLGCTARDPSSRPTMTAVLPAIRAIHEDPRMSRVFHGPRDSLALAAAMTASGLNPALSISTVGNSIWIWDADSASAPVEPTLAPSGPTVCAAISQYGLQIATGGEDGSIYRWDARSGALLPGGPMRGHTKWICSLAYSCNRGRARIVSSSKDRTIRVWDAGTGETVGGPFEGHQDSVLSVVFSPGGLNIASGSRDKTIRLWNSMTGAHMATLLGHERGVESLCFTPGGDRLVSGSWDQTVCVWNATTQQLEHRLRGHSSWIRSVAVSTSGRYAVSGSDDATLRVWDLEKGVSVGTPLIGHTASVTSVGFSPDGSNVVTGSLDGAVRVWDAFDCGISLSASPNDFVSAESWKPVIGWPPS